MADREKVLKGLAFHLKELTIGKTCFDCPYWGDNPCEIQLIANALELLKEQEAVVRCKDCKHQNWVNTETGCIVCKFGRGTNAPDWFCADGERKVSLE